MNSTEAFRRHIETITGRELEVAAMAQLAHRLRVQDASMHSLSLIDRHLMEQEAWLRVHRRMQADTKVWEAVERQVNQYAQIEQRLSLMADRERLFFKYLTTDPLVERMLLPHSNTEDAKKAPAKRRVQLPPGSRMTALASLLFSPRTMERVIDPMVADYRHEMFEAMARNDAGGRLGVIRTRYWLAFIVSVLEIAASAFGRVWRALKGS